MAIIKTAMAVGFPWLAIPLLVGLSACDRNESSEVGCAMYTSGPQNFEKAETVPPDAPFARRYQAAVREVREEVVFRADSAALFCVTPEQQAGDFCKSEASSYPLVHAHNPYPMSDDPEWRAEEEKRCECLALTPTWCEQAMLEGEEEAGEARARAQDEQPFWVGCFGGRVLCCFTLLRSAIGYPVRGPAVMAWEKTQADYLRQKGADYSLRGPLTLYRRSGDTGSLRGPAPK